MRHQKAGRKLKRTASHRKALLANLTAELFRHKQIRTTTAKAKEARRLAERMITFAKRGDLHARRMVLRRIRDRHLVKALFEEIAPKYADRNGGYTRILRLGRRPGDGAEVAILELVGYEGVQIAKEEEKARKRQERKKKRAERPEEEGEKPEEE
jgi:large subunit ribosomal protein L17